jgi:hypothetical protein
MELDEVQQLHNSSRLLWYIFFALWRSIKMSQYHSSFQQTLWQLQFTFTPNEYWSLLSKYANSSDMLWANRETETYWDKLPTYLIAHCPLCGSRYTNQADTHSLYYWRNTSPEHFQDAFPHPNNIVPCRHFVGVQRFVNLNGNLPIEFDYADNKNGDIPVVTPELVTHSPEAHAVIHSLPICRIEHNQFVPKYSVYLITYFADSPTAARKAVATRYASDAAEYHGSPLFCVSGNHLREPLLANLLYWVEQKKLSWLDLHDTNLPLTSSPSSEFPYHNVTGLGTPWVYRKRPKPRWGWQLRHWSPNGEIRDGRGKRLL